MARHAASGVRRRRRRRPSSRTGSPARGARLRPGGLSRSRRPTGSSRRARSGSRARRPPLGPLSVASRRPDVVCPPPHSVTSPKAHRPTAWPRTRPERSPRPRAPSAPVGGSTARADVARRRTGSACLVMLRAEAPPGSVAITVAGRSDLAIAPGTVGSLGPDRVPGGRAPASRVDDRIVAPLPASEQLEDLEQEQERDQPSRQESQKEEAKHG